MNFTVNRSQFQSKLEVCINALESRTYLDKRDGVLLEIKDSVLNIAVASLDMSISASVPVEAKESALVSVCLPTEKLIQCLKGLKDEKVTVVYDDKRVNLKGLKTKVSLIPYDLSSFTLFNTEDIKISHLDSLLIKGIIGASFAADGDDQRMPKGVLVRKTDTDLLVMAGDGNSMFFTLFNKEIAAFQSALFPLRVLDAVNDAIGASSGGAVSYGSGDNIMIFTVGDEYLIQARKSAFNSPSIERIAVQYGKDDLGSTLNFKVDKAELLEAIKLAYPFAESVLKGGTLRSCYFKAHDGVISVSSGTTAHGSVSTDLIVSEAKEGMDFCVNSKYMVNFLSKVDSKQIQLGYTDKNKPIVLKGERECLSYTQVISPINR